MIQILKNILSDEHFLGAFFQTLIIIALGYIFRRKNIITDDGKKAVTAVLLKIAVPCMAFNAFMTDFDRQTFFANLLILVVSLLMYIGFIGLSRIVFLRFGKSKAAVCGIFVAIGQVTLFSMPILKSIYSDNSAESMLTCNMITIGFRLMVYIYSFFVISRIKISRKSIGKSLKSIFFNPIIIAMLSGMLIWLIQNRTMQISTAKGVYSFLRFDKTIPALYSVVLSLEKLVSPLAMLIIGISLGRQSMKDTLSHKLSWIIAIARTVIVPLTVLVCICVLQSTRIVNFDETMAMTTVICFGAPVSATISIYCVQYDNEAELASQVCLISTLLCIVSIPLLYIMTEYALSLPMFSI